MAPPLIRLSGTVRLAFLNSPLFPSEVSKPAKAKNNKPYHGKQFQNGYCFYEANALLCATHIYRHHHTNQYKKQKASGCRFCKQRKDNSQRVGRYIHQCSAPQDTPAEKIEPVN